MSAAATRDALMPRPPGGLGRGAALALVVHAGLIAALAFSVNWRASTPAGVAAELWAAVPQFAAPRAAAPEPPPEPRRVEPAPPPPAARQPDAQIAIEKARKEEARREEQHEQERRRKEQAEKAERADKARKDEERLAAQREANLKRLLGQAGATGEPGATGSATRTAGPSASYAGRIRARIQPNIVFADSVSGNPLATVEVRLAPDGTIVGRRLVKASGIKAWDDAVLRAIDKTEVLPRDTDGRVPASFEIDFRPRD
jgi:colicin import membrane protein